MPRAYAVGAAFSVRDVADSYRWRPTDRYWTDVYYGPARPVPASNNRPQRTRSAPAPISRRVDPSRIRTPAQQKAAGQRVCAAG